MWNVVVGQQVLFYLGSLVRKLSTSIEYYTFTSGEFYSVSGGGGVNPLHPLCIYTTESDIEIFRKCRKVQDDKPQ